MEHFLRFRDLAPECDAHNINAFLDDAAQFKAGATGTALRGKSVVLIFEKPSLRTKLSFTLAAQKLGGTAVYFAPQEVGLGQREAVEDVAAVVSRMADMVVLRTFAQETLEKFAANSSKPVINALSDTEHPCQAMADLLTISEHLGRHDRTKRDFSRGNPFKVAYIGDGNNVAVSLAWAVAKAEGRFAIAAPEGHGLPPDDVDGVADSIEAAGSAEEAVEGADVVYTDAWISMGQEEQAAEKLAKFKGYQVTPELMARAKKDAIFMHPLPAHAGQEIAPEMLRHSQSVCFQQAENRLWAQMAIMNGIGG